jgi:hypothetical protein
MLKDLETQESKSSKRSGRPGAFEKKNKPFQEWSLSSWYPTPSGVKVTLHSFLSFFFKKKKRENPHSLKSRVNGSDTLALPCPWKTWVCRVFNLSKGLGPKNLKNRQQLGTNKLAYCETLNVKSCRVRNLEHEVVQSAKPWTWSRAECETLNMKLCRVRNLEHEVVQSANHWTWSWQSAKHWTWGKLYQHWTRSWQIARHWTSSSGPNTGTSSWRYATCPSDVSEKHQI